MTLRAAKPLALGDNVYAEGDVIPPAVIATLPPRRVEVLRSQRYVRVQGDTDLAATVAELTERVKALEARQPRRGRPPKNQSNQFDTADIGGK